MRIHHLRGFKFLNQSIGEILLSLKPFEEEHESKTENIGELLDKAFRAIEQLEEEVER